MAELLTNTGAKLWSKDDYDELWLQAFEELTGTSGKSNIRLIDETIGKINQNLDGYYFTYKNNRLYICKNENDKENIQQFPVSLIDDNGTIALSVDGTTITIDENGIVHGTAVDSTFSLTSKNPIQNKVVKAKFDEVNSSIESKGDSLLYDKDTKELKLNSDGKLISTANIKSPIVFSREQPTEQGVGDLWFVVEEITEEAGIYDANDMLLCSWGDSGIDDTCLNANSIISNYPTATRVIISNSVINIADGAFFKTDNLKEIEIPDSVRSIGKNAFYSCDNLNSVTINTVYKWYVGDSLSSKDIAIADSDILNPQVMAARLKDNTYFEKYLIRSDELQAGLYNADGAMLCSWEDSGIDVEKNYWTTDEYLASNTTLYSVIATKYPNITSIVIPDSITKLGDQCFWGCSSLISIKLPKRLMSIGSSAFCNCSSLTSITIPEGVTSIGGAAFLGCSSLTSITIPEGVTEIKDGTFQKCSSLIDVYIPNTVTEMKVNIFGQCTSLKSIELPDSITKIGTNTFTDCSSLTFVKLPNNITSIGMYNFYNCSSLTSITIPESVTSIGIYAFTKCSSLTSATFNNPNNWYVDDTVISSSNLSNTSTAAKYLRSTYVSKYWTHVVES